MPATPSQKALASVFSGFKFGLDDPASAERLAALGVGGFCLYGGEAGGIAAFTDRLQSVAARPLLFCGDYEEGLAVHVSGGTRLPSNMALGASGSEDLAELKGRITGLEARAIGVRWVLAPVLDLATQPANPIVNIRSFGSDPGLASRLGAAFMRGLASAGVLSCAKHFPGHGETRSDSHLELPTLELGREALGVRELVPFERTRGIAASVMVAHLGLPGLGEDPKTPSSLSKAVIAGLLRGELGYDGLVATDALSMRAVSARLGDEEACVRALLAGSDVNLVPADPMKAAYALASRAEADASLGPALDAAHARLERALASCGMGEGSSRPPPRAEGLGSLDLGTHRRQADEMAAACLTWVGPAATAAPKRLRYLEPDAGGPDDWQGKAFVEELRALGVLVEPYAAGTREPACVGSFLQPRAYTGRIRFSPEEAARASAALAAAPGAALVSFGSPFVFDDLAGWSSGLCAFSALAGAQRAAARALAGRAPAPGRLPVELKAVLRPRR